MVRLPGAQQLAGPIAFMARQSPWIQFKHHPASLQRLPILLILSSQAMIPMWGSALPSDLRADLAIQLASGHQNRSPQNRHTLEGCLL